MKRNILVLILCVLLLYTGRVHAEEFVDGSSAVLTSSDINTLAELNAIVSDATLLDDGAIADSNAIGLATGATHGTFGAAGDDTIDEMFTAIDTAIALKLTTSGAAAAIHLDDVLTTIGVASEATHMGTFTGSTITDNITAKAGIQLLETSLETKLATSGTGASLTAVCLESVFGTAIGTGLTLDSTTLKASTILQKYHGVDPSANVLTVLGNATFADIRADLDLEPGTDFYAIGTNIPVADGGTNSGTALNNDFVMVSSGGAIIESATVTATELGILNGVTTAPADLNIIDGISDSGSLTAAELLYVDGVTSAIQTQLNKSLFTINTTVQETVNADATPDVSNAALGTNNIYESNANGTITNFDDADDESEFNDGDWFIFFLTDASTTIDFSENNEIEGNAGVDFVGSATQIVYILFVYENTRWNAVNLTGGYSNPVTLALSSINMTGGTTETDNIDINDAKSIVNEKDTSDDYASWQATDDVGGTPAQVDMIKVTNAGTSAAPKVEVGGATSKSLIYLNAAADNMADHGYNGTVIVGIAAGSGVSEHNPVYLASDGKLDEADGDNALFPAIGLAVACDDATWDCDDTDVLTILTQGIVRDESWTGLTVGGAVYLSDAPATTTGITQTALTTANDCVQIIGWALSDSEIYFDFSRPYQLVE